MFEVESKTDQKIPKNMPLHLYTDFQNNVRNEWTDKIIYKTSEFSIFTTSNEYYMIF